MIYSTSIRWLPQEEGKVQWFEATVQIKVENLTILVSIHKSGGNLSELHRWIADTIDALAETTVAC